MVSATQAAQPNWMTPLVTVTPRLEQEFRWDVYDQQNGKGSQGNGQHIVSYGGPGGPRLEFIPAYNWEVILATSPYATASGPKGSAQGWGDWPAFLVKYRLLSANKENGDYIVTARNSRAWHIHVRWSKCRRPFIAVEGPATTGSVDLDRLLCRCRGRRRVK